MLCEIIVSDDRKRVWVNAADGSCIGRFSIRSGIDLHTTVAEQLAGADQCLFCTHRPATPEDWEVFRDKIRFYYEVDVSVGLISW